MGFLNIFANQAAKEMKPKMKYKGAVEEAKEMGKSSASKEGPAVSNDVDKEEFGNRYKGIQLVLAFILGIIAICIVQTFLTIGLINKASCLLLMSMAGIFYYKYSFMAWRAREVFKSWEKRNEPNPMYFSQYNDAIASNLKELFPIPLKNK